MSQLDTPNQSLSDDTVKAFLAVPDDKKRDALAKMNPNTKQALLTGIKAYKTKTSTIRATSTGQPKAPPSFLPTQPVPSASDSIASGLKDIGHNFEGMAKTIFGRPAVNIPAGAVSPNSPVVNIPQKGTPTSFEDIGKSIREMNDNVVSTFKQGKIAEGVAKSALMTAPLLAATVGSGGNPVALAEATAFVSPWLVSSFDKAKSDPIRQLVGIGGTIGLPAGVAKIAPKVGTFGEATVRWNKVTEDAAKIRDDNFSTAKGASIKAFADERVHLGKAVKSIADEDLVQSTNKGLPGSFSPPDLKKLLVQLKDANLGSKVSDEELPAYSKAIELIDSRGKAMSWNDAKQLRSSLARLKKNAAESSVFAKFDTALESQISKRASDIGRAAEYKYYTETTKALSAHKDGLYGKLASANTSQEFFDILKKNSNSPELKKLDIDLNRSGLPPKYLQNLYDAHTNIHKIVTNYRSGLVPGKVKGLMEHPVFAGAAGAAAYGAVGGFGVKLIASLVAISYAAELANKAGALEEMEALGGPKLVGGTLPPRIKPKGASPINPSTVGTPGGTPPVPLGMSPGPTNTPPTPTPGAPPSPQPGTPVSGTPPVIPSAQGGTTGISSTTIPKSSTLSEHIIQNGVEELSQEKAKITKVPEGQSGTGKFAQQKVDAERKAAERKAKPEDRTARTGGNKAVKTAEVLEAKRSLTSKPIAQMTVIDLEDEIKEYDPSKRVLSEIKKTFGKDPDIYRGKLIEVIEYYHKTGMKMSKAELPTPMTKAEIVARRMEDK